MYSRVCLVPLYQAFEWPQVTSRFLELLRGMTIQDNAREQLARLLHRTALSVFYLSADWDYYLVDLSYEEHKGPSALGLLRPHTIFVRYNKLRTTQMPTSKFLESNLVPPMPIVKSGPQPVKLPGFWNVCSSGGRTHTFFFFCGTELSLTPFGRLMGRQFSLTERCGRSGRHKDSEDAAHMGFQKDSLPTAWVNTKNWLSKEGK